MFPLPPCTRLSRDFFEFDKSARRQINHAASQNPARAALLRHGIAQPYASRIVTGAVGTEFTGKGTLPPGEGCDPAVLLRDLPGVLNLFERICGLRSSKI